MLATAFPKRQRYARFGFEPAGFEYAFAITRANVRHCFGKETAPELSVRRITRENQALLAETESSDPQIIADKLFGKAMINYDEKPKDDITVIVARIKQ